MPPKIVVLDARYANPGDLSWEEVSTFGETVFYDQTPPEQVVSRSADAEILVINKIRLGKQEFTQLPKLKLVCITATGTDNVNQEDAKQLGIQVKNVVGYSTHSVAQHVFALILHITNQVSVHDRSVHAGDWNASKGFSYTLDTIPDLTEKSIGIYGFGSIGKRVAQLAHIFGMTVHVASRHTDPSTYPKYRFMDVRTLFSTSDFVSLHAPLSSENDGIVNHSLLSTMKSSAFLINTARGGLINERDLAECLAKKQIRGAALDVLSTEPPPTNHPLLSLDNCVITPHLAWTSLAARRELIRMTGENIRSYLNEKRPS